MRRVKLYQIKYKAKKAYSRSQKDIDLERLLDQVVKPPPELGLVQWPMARFRDDDFEVPGFLE